MLRMDKDTNNMAAVIGFSLAVMLSFIATTILSLVFSDMKRENIADLAILAIILIAVPVLLMIKAYYSESLKTPQHPFFAHKFRKIKMVIFSVVFFTIILALGRNFA